MRISAIHDFTKSNHKEKRRKNLHIYPHLILLFHLKQTVPVVGDTTCARHGATFDHVVVSNSFRFRSKNVRSGLHTTSTSNKILAFWYKYFISKGYKLLQISLTKDILFQCIKPWGWILSPRACARRERPRRQLLIPRGKIIFSVQPPAPHKKSPGYSYIPTYYIQYSTKYPMTPNRDLVVVGPWLGRRILLTVF